MRILCVLMLLSAGAAPLAAAGTPGETLTTVRDLLGQPGVASGEAHPVRIRGVLTAFDLGSTAFFLQDRTGGVKVLAFSKPARLAPGDWIEVEGVTSPGPFAPAVLARRIRVLGNAPFPPPLRVPWFQISAGLKHGQWIEVTGDVTAVTTEDGQVVVRITSGEGDIEAHIAGVERTWLEQRLVNARVRIEGTSSARFNAADQFIGAAVLVPGPNCLVVVRAGPANPFDTPPTAIRDILKYRHGEHADNRLLVSGVVSLFRPGTSLFLTDGEDHLYVTTSGTETLQPGDRVAVLGYPDFIEGAPALVNGIYRRVSAGQGPPATRVSAEQVLDSKHDSGLISLEAQLLQSSAAAGQRVWLLRAGAHTFEAVLDTDQVPHWVASLAPDSILLVRGVCILLRGGDGHPYGLKLRLRTADDLQLIQRPSWWTARRVLVLTVAVGLIALAALGWMVSLRRQVRRQTTALQARLESEASVREALHHSEERYRRLFEGSRDALMTLAPPSWRFTAGNPATVGMFGANDEAEFLSASLGDVSPERQPDGRVSAEKALEEIGIAMREGSHFFEWTHKTLNGREFPATVLLTRVEAGGQAFLQATVRDITEQKRVEQALARSARVSGRLKGFLDDISSYQTEGEMLEPLLCTAVDICGASGGGVYTVADGAAVLTHHRHLPDALVAELSRIPLSAPIPQLVLNTAGPVVVSDASPERAASLRANGLRHAATIALYSGREVAGFLQLFLDRPEPFSEADLHYLGAVALEAGAAFERIQRQRALQEHARKLRQILDTAATAVFMVAPDRRITEVNDAFCRSTGFAPEEVVGQACDVLRGDPCMSGCGLYESAGTPAIFHRQCTIHAKDGRRLTIIKNAAVVRDDAGAITGGIESFVDVTSLVEAREAATRETAKLRSMIEGMDEGIVVVDAEEIVTEVNQWFLGKVGIGRDDIVGRMLTAAPVGADLLTCLREILDVFRGGKRCQVHVVNRELLGLQISLRAQPILEAGRYRGIILNFINVTDLTEARRAAEMASAAKSQFLANMSHEIRTPMTAIMGFADVLLDGGSLSGTPQERIDAALTIKRNGEYLLDLINDILDLSKVEAGRFEVERMPCSPFQVVAQVESLMRVRCHEKKIDLHVEWEGRIPDLIQSDPTRLRQILINLMGNAIKFTEAGHVRLIGCLGTLPDGSPALQFDVVDTGLGIPDSQRAHLFQPFSQADASMTRRFGGTGLGLAICKRLAEALGGHVQLVETRPGAGSRFRVLVPTGVLDGTRMLEPAAAMLAVASDGSSEPPPAVERLACRILLAEDGPDNQRLISRLLQKAGATVTIVDNGRLAVEAALEGWNPAHPSQFLQPFDVILMDVQMPVMDGLAATATLRGLGYTGPIIALTAHAMKSDRQKCLDAGCDAYASKPIDRAELIETIRRQVNGGRPNPVESARASDRLVSEFAGDPDWADLIEEFIDELPARVRALEQAQAEGDVDTVIRLAHQLKGSAGGYGFPSITEQAANLERVAKGTASPGQLAEAIRAVADLCRRTEPLQASCSPPTCAPSLVPTH